MDLRLTDEQAAVRDTFAALFQREATPRRVREAERTGWDAEFWRRYTELGALEIGVPSSLGGGDGGLLELALVAEEAGRRVVPIPVVRPAVAARLLGRVGAKELLATVLDGTHLVSVATHPGSVARQLLVDGAVADAVLTLDDGYLCHLARPPEQRAVLRPNVGSLPMAHWTATGVSTTLATGPEAERLFAVALDETRILTAAALVGLAEESVGIGARYASVRQAFGQAIGMYQAVSHPFADAVAAVDGARLLVWKACWALDSGRHDGPELAAMAFVFAAETAYDAAAHSLHVHGGYGFMEEYDIQLYYRRAKAWATAFADPRRELLTVADRRFEPARRRLPAGQE
ncbi:acyl-CoA dehydrogenase [Nocardia miyunensis]|uniref:acyl-CoA dehydrogenase n=1 Tax=Nocardia miyunensis TaxID=282684 RepID=UPI00082A6065|nr:acyl-CoA dehydrogenase [Nocardia miyunensis]